MNKRNNMVFTEFDWEHNPPDENSGSDHSGIGIKGKWMSELDLYKQQLEELAEGECLGPACCNASGVVWDSASKKCKTEGYSNMLTPSIYKKSNLILNTKNPGGKYYSNN